MYVFLDTEFTNFVQRQLISIGLVSLDGKHTFYKEVKHYCPSICSEFVKDTVIPLLSCTPETMIPLRDISALLRDWFLRLDSDNVTVIVDHEFDLEQLRNLLGEIPEWIELANIGYFLDDTAFEQFFKDNNLKQHHALNDAMANRHAFLIAQAEYMKNQKV